MNFFTSICNIIFIDRTKIARRHLKKNSTQKKIREKHCRTDFPAENTSNDMQKIIPS